MATNADMPSPNSYRVATSPSPSTTSNRFCNGYGQAAILQTSHSSSTSKSPPISCIHREADFRCSRVSPNSSRAISPYSPINGSVREKNKKRLEKCPCNRAPMRHSLGQAPCGNAFNPSNPHSNAPTSPNSSHKSISPSQKHSLEWNSTELKLRRIILERWRRILTRN